MNSNDVRIRDGLSQIDQIIIDICSIQNLITDLRDELKAIGKDNACDIIMKAYDALDETVIFLEEAEEDDK